MYLLKCWPVFKFPFCFSLLGFILMFCILVGKQPAVKSATQIQSTVVTVGLIICYLIRNQISFLEAAESAADYLLKPAVNRSCSAVETPFVQAFRHRCAAATSSQRRIDGMSALQWSCCSSRCSVAKETCCQPPRPSFFLSLRCLLLPYCPMAWGNSWLSESSSPPLPALPPRPPSPPTSALWAHIDWLSASPKKSRAAWGAGCSFLSVLLKKKVWKKEGKKGKKSGGGQIISRLRHNLSRYVCLFRRNENQLGFSQFLLFLSIVLPRCLQSHVLLLPPPLPRCFSPNLCNLIFWRPPSARCCY